MARETCSLTRGNDGEREDRERLQGNMAAVATAIAVCSEPTSRTPFPRNE